MFNFLSNTATTHAAADSYTVKLLLAPVYELFLSPTAALIAEQIIILWRQIRGAVLVPLLRVVVIACTVMSIVVLMEKVFIGLVSLYMKVFRRRPENVYKCDAIVAADAENGAAAFPMVMVQIPMYNEKEVYQLSIGAACKLSWPLDRLIVQVLDDSTDPIIQDLVKNECDEWSKKGINIRYETRKDRAGYKAGNLKEGMKHSYVECCEYVAMFDADFQPEPDFLMKTIPFLVHNPKLALVQSRWKFVNADDCLLTRMQEMSMDYHFKVEQEAGSSMCAFFGYNGTAGVWRTRAIMEAGGWEDRTTAEDMDLAVRASLLGWGFVYVGDIKVKSELPSTLKAYRSQQHRWSCGPALLFKKMLWDILEAKKVSMWKKFYMIYSFFVARRIISAFFTFFFFSILLPVKIFFPEVIIPKWELLYVPTVITLLNSVGTPRSLHLIILWVLFENVMSLHRCKAIFIGLLEAGRANEWIVTEKLGDMLKTKPVIRVTENLRIKERFHLLELGLGVFLLLCAFFDYAFRRDCFYLFILPQSITYFIVGFGFIGIIIPS
ncbi:probable mannan synthase 6 [Ananas comosus]|uniref:glucomannan 4-beta-mannosyltransferase n=2 Tax=Ananas comosus TaxID=4615 RepID=A0A6P5FBR5_ANACO|nr:probable mannan synthase 6 [Ananas comosus]CAD1826821.1 unnamed protein product [Ananas comosus var. bracteatus]